MKKDCLSCKKVFKNNLRHSKNNLKNNPKKDNSFKSNNKERLPQNLEEYMKVVKKKNI